MPVDHFKFYRLQETDSDLDVSFNVSLRGQFDANLVPATLDELVLFGTPVNKNGEGIISDDNHMTIYDFALSQPQPIRTLGISNQFFASTTLQIAQAIGLMVPTQKIVPGNHEPPQGLDHYKLYRVINGEAPMVNVSLEDQFMSENNVVGTPMVFGVPCAKLHNGELNPINNPVDHLVIYRLENRNLNVAVESSDQFGDCSFSARRCKFLAVPTMKNTVDGVVIEYPQPG